MPQNSLQAAVAKYAVIKRGLLTVFGIPASRVSGRDLPEAGTVDRASPCDRRSGRQPGQSAAANTAAGRTTLLPGVLTSFPSLLQITSPAPQTEQLCQSNLTQGYAAHGRFSRIR